MPTSPAAIAASGLLAVGAALAGTAASADPEPTPAALAGGFLERQLVAGGHSLPYPGTTQADLGLTIDAALGMIAGGVGRDEGTRTLGYVETHLDDYVGPTWGPRELYAGPVAKSVLLAATFDLDPTHFGGHDLLSDLASLQDKAGRYTDRTAYSDTSNVFTQGLALLALTRTGAAVPAKGVRFLRDQQCADGGFRMFPAKSDCVSDPDATALAVTALRARESEPGSVKLGLDFLEARMLASGGIPGGAGAEGANSNTTALAAMAFAVSGRTASYGLAGGYLRSLQFGCIVPASLRGAIAYDAESFAAQVAAGLTAEPADQERRASAQAAIGLAGVALSDLTSGAATPGGPEPACSSTTSPTSTSSPSGASSTTSATSTTSSTFSSSPSTAATSTSTRPPSLTSTRTGTSDASTSSPTVNSTVPVSTSTTPDPDPSATAAATGTSSGTYSGQVGARTSSGPSAASTLPRNPAAGPGALTRTEQTALAAAVAGVLLLLGAVVAAVTRYRGRHH